MLVIGFLAAAAPATELCADWPRRIEPDMQMPEAAFSDEAAASARQLLARIAAGELTDYDWTVPANAEKVIEGNALWRSAQGKPPESSEVETFCRFLVEQGFYYD